jgi:PTH1 family peptidyl-tRNA hydrolase
MPSPNRLIVGLGNPGTEYEGTRHNIGFMVVDALALRYHCGAWKKKFKGFVTAHATDPAFFLLKPLTFMNLSGESVAEAMRFYQFAPEDVIVFHDDLDLLPGQVKIKQGGGTGGHNGLKSIDAHIGQDYWRVRLGIGHPGVKGEAVTNHVLNTFAKADKAWLEPLLDMLVAEFDMMLQGDATGYAKRITEKMNELLKQE